MALTPTARDRERAREFRRSTRCLIDYDESAIDAFDDEFCQALADERERCAWMLDALHDATPDYQAQYRAALRDGAQAIRQGG
jgi:hypothetical protein